MKSDNILITGGTGFLGSNLLKSLLDSGYNVSIIKRSFSDLFRIKDVEKRISAYNIDEVSIEYILGETQPNIIIHCATDYGRKNISRQAIIEANLILPLKLLELCPKNNVRCFINTDTFLDKGISHYSLSKKQFKDWLETFSSDLICINMVLEHFFGPFDDRTKFVSYIIEQFLLNSPEINLTPAEQKRDFIFIDDVVSAFLFIIKSIENTPPGFYNYEIGTNRQIEIKKLVEMIKGLTNNKTTQLKFGALSYRENEIMESNVDTKAIKKLGWTAKYSLQEGLQKTIDSEKDAIKNTSPIK